LGSYEINHAVLNRIIEEKERKAPDPYVILEGDNIKVMAHLRNIGFALEEIGEVFNISRQGVFYLLGPTGNRTSKTKRPDIEDLKPEFWKTVFENRTDWYGTNNRLIRSKVMDWLQEQGYTWDMAETSAKELVVPHTQIVLLYRYNIPVEHHQEWLYEQLDGRSVRVLWEELDLDHVSQNSLRRYMNAN